MKNGTSGLFRRVARVPVRIAESGTSTGRTFGGGGRTVA